MSREVMYGAAADVTNRLAGLVGWLGRLPERDCDDGGLVDVMAGLERVRAAVSAAQLRTIAAFDSAQRSARAAAGVASSRAGLGVAAQVGLACRISPQAAAARLATARGLVDAMPATLAAMTGGEVSEWVAAIVERETRCLPVHARRVVDARLGRSLVGMGPRQAEHAAWWEVVAADQAAAERRGVQARAARRVWVRMGPDAMARLVADVSVEDGLAVKRVLDVQARRLRRDGDRRLLDQLRADLLVGRVTGRDPAYGPAAVEIGLVMTPHTLFDPSDGSDRHDRAADSRGSADSHDSAGSHGSAGSPAPAGSDRCDPSAGSLVSDRSHGSYGSDGGPACLLGYGPIPAGSARRLAGLTDTGEDADGADAGDDGGGGPLARTKVWIRRLFTDPVDATVTMVDDRRRVFPPQIARLVTARDRHCRMPSCHAPIRHLDHVVAFADGGATTVENAQGLCEHHNYVKQAPGWSVATVDGRSRQTIVTTPTGHTYDSYAPPALGP